MPVPKLPQAREARARVVLVAVRVVKLRDVVPEGLRERDHEVLRQRVRAAEEAERLGRRARPQPRERLVHVRTRLQPRDEVVGHAPPGERVLPERSRELRRRRHTVVLPQQFAVDRRRLLRPEAQRARAAPGGVVGRLRGVGERRELFGDRRVRRRDCAEPVGGPGELRVLPLEKVDGGFFLFLEALEGLVGERERVLFSGVFKSPNPGR